MGSAVVGAVAVAFPAASAAAAEPRREAAPAAGTAAPRSRAEPAAPGKAPSKAAPAPAKVPLPPPPAAAARPKAPPPRRLAIDAGVGVGRQALTWSGGAAPRDFTARLAWSPTVRLEATPFSGAEGRWWAGAAAFAAYARSLGLETRVPDGDRRRTTLSRLEAGAGLWFQPAAAWRGRLLARASYRQEGLEVRPALGGLPDLDLAGPALGLDLEAPAGERVTVIAGGSYVLWTRARDLAGTSAYWGSGSAWGLELAGGASLALRPGLSLRALATWERTAWSLSGASAYQATGAVLSAPGVAVLLRAEL